MNSQQWVDYLTGKLDRSKDRALFLRSYTDGHAPLPEMGPNLKASWEAFQRKSLTNSGGLVVSTLAERIVPNGIIIGDANDSPEVLAAQRVWRDNRMDVAVADSVFDALTTGFGYLLVTNGPDGHAVVTREDAAQFYVEPDPTQPWKALAAVKVWRVPSLKTDYMVVWADGVKLTYTRDSYTDNKLIRSVQGGWMPTLQMEEYDGNPPVVILENKDGRGEFQSQLGLIDRINWGILQRLVTMSMQAFRQRALKVDKDDAYSGEGLPDQDEDGNDIDYQSVFAPAPGALWELPPGVEIWESQQTSFQDMLAAVKDDWRELAAETATPLSAMLPDSANQSANGAEEPQKQLVFKAKDRIQRFRPALNVAMVKALQVEGVDIGDQTLEVVFEPPNAVSMTEKYAAAAQAKAAGEALETIQRNILGYSPEQIAQDKQRRAEEQLNLALNTLPNQKVSNGADSTQP